MKKMTLGEILIERGIIERKEIEKALAYQKRNGGKIGEILVDMGIIGKEYLENLVSELTGAIPFRNSNIEVDDDLITNFNKNLIEKYKAVPVKEEKDILYVLTSDPFDLNKMDELKFYFGKKIKFLYLIEKDFKSFLKPYIHTNKNKKDTEIFELFQRMITRAVEKKASDIHIESHGEKKIARFRINGMLQDQPCKIPKDVFGSLLNYIKILANLDITKTRIPQDGQFLYFFENKEIPIRVSTIPSQYGEKMVLRLLYRNNNLAKLENLGMDELVLELFKKSITQLNGLVLVTGPTGSGKTTTLYAALEHINTPDKNICTLEDPIEIRLSGIIQSHVDEKSGFTFAKGLRSLLRQDPDIIMVGEIRYEETAQIAANAALTGHLVLATLHTITSAGAIYRLKEMDVKPEILSQSLNCVLNQRLLKKLCPNCRYKIGVEKRLNIESYSSKGCEKCNGSGYSGRVGVYEILYFTDEAKEELRKPNPENLDSFIVNPLWKQGIKYVQEGIISLNEFYENIRIPSKVEEELKGKKLTIFPKEAISF